MSREKDFPILESLILVLITSIVGGCQENPGMNISICYQSDMDPVAYDDKQRAAKELYTEGTLGDDYLDLRPKFIKIQCFGSDNEVDPWGGEHFSSCTTIYVDLDILIKKKIVTYTKYLHSTRFYYEIGDDALLRRLGGTMATTKERNISKTIQSCSPINIRLLEVSRDKDKKLFVVVSFEVDGAQDIPYGIGEGVIRVERWQLP